MEMTEKDASSYRNQMLSYVDGASKDSRELLNSTTGTAFNVQSNMTYSNMNGAPTHAFGIINSKD